MTLGWGGGGGINEVSHILLFIFKILLLMLFEEKIVVTKQDTAPKDAFFLTYIIFQSNIGLKISHQKIKNVTRGGQKSAKKYYLYGHLD